jgi:hypothetical protein
MTFMVRCAGATGRLAAEPRIRQEELRRAQEEGWHRDGGRSRGMAATASALNALH